MGVWNPKGNSLFVQAVEMSSPDQRVAFLDEACAGDPPLRAEVEQLLKAHDDAGSFLQRPLLGDQQTQDLGPATDGDDPPAEGKGDRHLLPERPATNLRSVPGFAQKVPVPFSTLDFLEPCDVPGRLGKIGPYEVIEVIGFGGMGVVLRAHDTKLNRVVAVKVMAPAFAVNPTARKRFLREAQAAAAVTHPNVITIHAVDETEKTPYLVMECIDALSLEEKIDRCGHLEIREILRIGAQIAAGLAAAHAQGLVHRDIKPSNILLEDGVERVKITDFGLARAVDDVEVTRSGEVLGTPQFMSPEQAQGKTVDCRSDLFSLGTVLYTMCTGRSPFRAETTVAVLRRVCDDAPRSIRQVNPDIPEELVSIVDWLLAKDPDERFQTAQEVSDLLYGYLAHLQDPTSTPPLELLREVGRISNPSYEHPAAARKTPDVGPAPGGRWWRRTMTLAAAVLLGLCVSVAITDATGVTHLATTLLRIATGSGTLVIDVDDPQVSITIDGEDLVITGAGPKEVRLKPGQYHVQAAKGGQVVKQELVTIERGGRQVVKVALESPVTPLTKGDATPSNPWVELLPRIDQKCLLEGQWERRGDALVSVPLGGPFARRLVELPIAVEGSYDIQIDFTVISGDFPTCVSLPVGDTHCAVTFGSFFTSCDGIERVYRWDVVTEVDGQAVLDKRNPTAREGGGMFEPGEHSVLIKVRVKGDVVSIGVSRDGRPHLSWTGKQEALSMPHYSAVWGRLDPRRPGMLLWGGRTYLDRVRARRVSDDLGRH